MVKKDKTLLIGVNINNQYNFQESMTELKNLAIACDFEVVGQTEQNLKAINKAFYIGSGKLEEIKFLADELEVNALVFNNELSPSQLRNLARTLEYKIMDRTSLILEIFARRAKTREAKLQVEMARMQYMLPRLIGLNVSLAQQSGGVGTTTRGPGEKALELDRRKIERKIYELNKELESISNERKTQRKKRNKTELPTVALVGYTNAGKSTLMNAMVETSKKPESKKVLEKDVLFATLDTSVRKIILTDKRTFLLLDTVGFISNIPHSLVKAFRSTLEEVSSADLLLHVVDISSPDYEQQIEVTDKTLQEIGAESIPTIYVFNKADLIIHNIAQMGNDKVYISAIKKEGMDELVKLINQKIFRQYIACKMFIPYEQGSLLSYLNDNANIKSVSYQEEGTLLTLECKKSDYKRYKQFTYAHN